MGDIKITLKSARVNAGMTQAQAAQALSEYFGMTIPRQRVMKYEANPSLTPIAFGEAFAKIYKIPIEGINFLDHPITIS
ncbi:XRE family transcriptional regulator [Limosilactobacillus fermentum]|uniref:helix-turn-helix domain-containing protein n=1 Tax=Limosilactobacillus fermentum TaxID=1613 RepID=UPI000E4E40DB|nr:helix-turn-helix transcriptional regulator [Limosilactobacillus fermentum]RGU53934.1 XRE family transcriptional regulator [Limosilactobacillus fermentum]